MRQGQKLSLAIGCLLGLGACSNTGTTTNPNGTAGTTSTSPMGGTPAASGGTPSTPPTSGSGTTPKAGTSGGTAGTTTAPTGMAGTSAVGAAGMAAAGTGAGGAGPTAGSSSSATAGFATCGKPPKDGMCKSKAPGVYAMKVDVDVWYMDEINGSLFDPGRGKVTIYFRNTLRDVCEDGTMGKVDAHPCGTRIPALYTSLGGNGVIQIVFPDDLWDKPGVPTYMTTGSTTGFDPGATLTIDKSVGLLGVELSAVDAMWPTWEQTPTFECMGGKKGPQCFPDVDGDGKPGFAVTMQTTGTPPTPGYGSGWKYIPAPTDPLAALSGDGTTNVNIGLRTRVGGSGMISADCNSGMGSAMADDFESRVNDCTKVGGTACSSMEAGFVDQNTPLFHVLAAGATPPSKWMSAAMMGTDASASKGPLSTVVRLGDIDKTFTCADVRAAFPTN
jgi:hypothetical protein